MRICVRVRGSTIFRILAYQLFSLWFLELECMVSWRVQELIYLQPVLFRTKLVGSLSSPGSVVLLLSWLMHLTALLQITSEMELSLLPVKELVSR